MRNLTLALITPLLALGTATAAGIYPANIDFTGISTTQDITLQGSVGGQTPNSYSLNGVTFQYDPNQGGSASIDSNGIYGSTASALNIYFDSPAVGLIFAYDVMGLNGVPASCSGGYCMDAYFDGVEYLPINGNPSGTASFGSRQGPLFAPATPFSLVTLYFTTDVANFDVTSLGYDSTTPEPATFCLLGAALLGLGGRKLLKRRP